jgi:hypothetical protein
MGRKALTMLSFERGDHTYTNRVTTLTRRQRLLILDREYSHLGMATTNADMRTGDD